METTEVILELQSLREQMLKCNKSLNDYAIETKDDDLLNHSKQLLGAIQCIDTWIVALQAMSAKKRVLSRLKQSKARK